MNINSVRIYAQRMTSKPQARLTFPQFATLFREQGYNKLIVETRGLAFLFHPRTLGVETKWFKDRNLYSFSDILRVHGISGYRIDVFEMDGSRYAVIIGEGERLQDMKNQASAVGESSLSQQIQLSADLTPSGQVDSVEVAAEKIHRQPLPEFLPSETNPPFKIAQKIYRKK